MHCCVAINVHYISYFIMFKASTINVCIFKIHLFTHLLPKGIKENKTCDWRRFDLNLYNHFLLKNEFYFG